MTTSFTRNYTDHSNAQGYQFEFHCDKCGSGFRSSAATSILSKHRFTHLYNVVGGMTAWNNATAAAPNTCAANRG